MGDIVDFPGVTRLDLDPDDVLSNIGKEFSLAMCTVVGVTEDGETFVFTSQSHDGDTLMMLERGKDLMMENYRGLSEYDDR